MLLSPRHPEVERWTADPAVAEQLDELRSGGWERSARDASAVPVIDTGASTESPAGDELPVFVSPMVDARYGPTAALGIPAVDEADEAIAARMPRVAGEPLGGGPVARPSATRGDALPRLRLLDLAPALLGHADPGRPLRGVRGGAGPARGPAGACCRATSSRPAKGNPLAERPDFVEAACPRCGDAAPSARPTRSTATSTRSGSGCRRRCRPRPAPSRCSPTPTCSAGCPPSGSSPATTAAASSSTSGS